MARRADSLFMANKEHVKVLQLGVEPWNQWRMEHPEIRPDLNQLKLELTSRPRGRTRLSAINFRDAYLRGANLELADLANAEFAAADLTAADLGGAWLYGADFTNAILRGANLSAAVLCYATFRAANLMDAKFSTRHLSIGASVTADVNHILEGTDFGKSVMGGTTLVDIDISEARGLEAVQHNGPSHIGIETIYYSRGKIPDTFLRGAGVPESFISQVKALVSSVSPVEFYSCFISYSSRDQELADRLHADLRANRVRCWFAPEDLKIGDQLRSTLDEGIRIYDKVIVLLSENSLKSPWVEKEIETAFEKERKQNRTVLFPVRLDDSFMETTQAWAADIRRTRHVGDFRNWKNHDSYKKSLNRLLRDLQVDLQ